MKRTLCRLLAISVTMGAFANETDVCARVRASLTELHRTAHPYLLREAAIVADFEVGMSHVAGEPSTAFRPIVEVMSNDWKEVFASFEQCATNVVDRIVLENTGWFLGEEAYLGYLSTLTDMVIAGRLPFNDLRLFEMYAWHNHSVASVLCRRYQEPAITNLVGRMLMAGFPSNQCVRILSGEEYRAYQTNLVNEIYD